jgi:arylsulfatase
LKVDGKVVATEKMERTIPLVFTVEETFDIGADTGSPVDDRDYQVPYNFTGKIDKLTIAIDRPVLSQADIQKLRDSAARAADAK